MPKIGYINLYQYPNTKRLHAGTGVYPSFEVALNIAKHKPNYINTVKIKGISEQFKESPDKGGFFKDA